MEAEERYTEAEFHKKMAAQQFNSVWERMENRNRTPAEDARMIHAAHASCFHWEQVGTPENLMIGEWQISRVYAVLKRAEPALYHARYGLELCREHQKQGFLLAYAYEAMARALSLTQDSEAAQYLHLAHQSGEQIDDGEDREHLLEDLKSIEEALEAQPESGFTLPLSRRSEIVVAQSPEGA